MTENVGVGLGLVEEVGVGSEGQGKPNHILLYNGYVYTDKESLIDPYINLVNQSLYKSSRSILI